MKKFKVGSVIVFKNVPNCSAKEGALAIVIGNDEEFVEVHWLKGTGCGTQNDGGYSPSNFHLYHQEALVIAGYDVEINADETVNVGCTKVTFKEVETLYNAIREDN